MGAAHSKGYRAMPKDLRGTVRTLTHVETLILSDAVERLRAGERNGLYQQMMQDNLIASGFLQVDPDLLNCLVHMRKVSF